MLGARPADGSSTSSSTGSLISARPMARLACCPPDRVPASARRLSARTGKLRIGALESAGPTRPVAPAARERAEPEVLLDRQLREDLPTLRDVADAERDPPSRRQTALTSCPPMRTDPDHNGNRPEIVFNVTDLPAPLSPKMPCASPASTIEVDAVKHLRRAESGDELRRPPATRRRHRTGVPRYASMTA